MQMQKQCAQLALDVPMPREISTLLELMVKHAFVIIDSEAT